MVADRRTCPRRRAPYQLTVRARIPFQAQAGGRRPLSMPPLRSAPRVLWVTEEPPDFVDKGGSIRQAHLFRPLAERFPTDLLLTRELHDPAILAAARTVLRAPAPRAPWPERNLTRRALTLAIAAGSRLPTDAS